ncbi:hypothetical protein LTR36_004050 [Oleoguttula mirabilis]|uniref:Uncharacterized protein n=1 Tax=Oleoguttula mirabilis TaxID=1507867 RepID=A0AAV9JIR8_9PEZI|nr:hypothetical protein LTR36_004050 [Oleoguttula mirabilis]
MSSLASDASVAPFRFFDLARELRNLIYSHLTSESDVVYQIPGPMDHAETATTKDFCMAEFFLVNRQSKREYELEIFRPAHVIVHGVFPFDLDVYRALERVLPGYVGKIQHVTVQVEHAWYTRRHFGYGSVEGYFHREFCYKFCD